MKFDILTLFPEMVQTVLSTSIIGRAKEAGKIEINCHQIREFSKNKHRNTDDTPYGGGNGMVMTAQPIADCLLSVLDKKEENEVCRVVYLSPKGSLFTQEKAAELLSCDRLVLLCGHYEGVDQRILDEFVDEEISIGDYVLTGGELPACIVVDAVARQIDGVLASPESYTDESIACGLLEYPQYTHPAVFRGKEVPAVLLSGNHGEIAKWRLEQSLALTKERRPDLYESYIKAHPPAPQKTRKKRSKTPQNSL
ncbi:MAG: tRNA (guanosine(37)-N1)-methyltransferase TrmD [Clostridia bacterium]|nr:tRNA (guanosine(37)-N1)-methyltransferase TrmD [Clostridia bacterium]